MSENRKRTEVVSVRLDLNELAELQRLAGDQPISTYIREKGLAAALRSEQPAAGVNPHAVYRRGRAWSLGAAPGRMLGIGWARSLIPNLLHLRSAADARALAAALIELADLIEQPEPGEAVA